MRSKWYHIKNRIIELRQQGYSYRKLEAKFGVPRSTLSGWLKNIKLTKGQKKKLRDEWKKGLVHARSKAILWHNAQKNNRIEEARSKAKRALSQIRIEDKGVLRIALALLYLGEGTKKNEETALGSTDPIILRFFMKTLEVVYGLDMRMMRFELALRADQNPEKIKLYWAKTLGIPTWCIKQINIDKRTMGTKTYDHYKGVCHIRCANVAIQRELLFLSKMYCQAVIDKS